MADRRGTPLTDPRLTAVPVGRLLSIDQIALLADVAPATVASWKIRDNRGRREVQTLPKPVLPTEAQTTVRTPLYDLAEVLKFLNVTARIPQGGPRFSAAGIPAGIVASLSPA